MSTLNEDETYFSHLYYSLPNNEPPAHLNNHRRNSNGYVDRASKAQQQQGTSNHGGTWRTYKADVDVETEEFITTTHKYKTMKKQEDDFDVEAEEFIKEEHDSWMSMNVE